MSPAVHELQNAVRAATGRFEREVAASFTKEELQAVCKALGVDTEASGRPSTGRMRRQIRVAVDLAASAERADDAAFRKAELRTLADRLDATVES